jgi:hypothetical protein
MNQWASMRREDDVWRRAQDVASARKAADCNEFVDITGTANCSESPLHFTRSRAASTVVMLVAINAGERFMLAIVPIGDGGFAQQPVYVRRPFRRRTSL